MQYEIKDTLFHLALIADTLNGCKDRIPLEILEFTRGNLRVALFSQTKALAYFSDAFDKHQWEDAYLIVDEGTKGLDEILYKYGMIPEPLHMVKNRKRPKFAFRIFELSQKEMIDSRREIYEECEKFGRDKLTKQILDLIEGVTQGTKPWSHFQREVILALTPHLEVAIQESKLCH